MSKSKPIKYHEQKSFKEVDFAHKVMRNREFNSCHFIDCDFTESDLRTNVFEDCTFDRCNFSMAEIEGASFRKVKFIGSKLLGLDFSRCNTFGLSFYFEETSLDYSVFFDVKLKNTRFINCSLREIDFSNADLSGAVFTGSDFLGARFMNTNLEKSDFRTAENFSIDPTNNKIRKAKFSSFQLSNLLQKYELEIE